jgi:hypothetical protein
MDSAHVLADPSGDHINLVLEGGRVSEQLVALLAATSDVPPRSH